MVDSLNQSREQLLEEAKKRVELNEQGTERSPWLERIGWLEYLEGIDRKELLEWVAEPDEEKEPLVWLMWQAAEKMIETCQYNVEHRAGLYARLQAVRVEAYLVYFQKGEVPF